MIRSYWDIACDGPSCAQFFPEHPAQGYMPVQQDALAHGWVYRRSVHGPYRVYLCPACAARPDLFAVRENVWHPSIALEDTPLRNDPRTLCALRRRGITTVGDVVQLTTQEFLSLKGVGATMLHLVESVVGRLDDNAPPRVPTGTA